MSTISFLTKEIGCLLPKLSKPTGLVKSTPSTASVVSKLFFNAATMLQRREQIHWCGKAYDLEPK